MKRLLFLFYLFLIAGTTDSYGSHLMGGEITWTCQKTGPNTGRFQFTVKLYRDCSGIPAPPNVQLYSNAPGLGGGINCNPISAGLDLSPVGPGCPTCANPTQPNAVQEFEYRSGFITITGVPPAAGWYFAYSDCCRNTGAITNLAASGGGNFTLRALMFPYNATNTNPCYDTSPRFAERPQLATMIGNLTTYSANAVDEEGDSLHYEWGRPLDGGTYPGTNYPYNANYSFTSPLPGPTFNPLNVAAALNPNTGTVNFTSFTQGSFVTVTKVSAFRCGIKIAEVYREIQITLLPNVTIADQNNLPALNSPPDIDPLILPPSFQTVNVNQFVDTVLAGDTILLPITAYDFEHTTINPASPFQSVSFDVTGIELDTSETANTGKCPYPPCAYLSANVPTGYAQFSNFITFNWVTDCNHLSKTVGCVRLSNTYNFVVKAFDNFCPSPAVNFYTFSIVVNAPPEMNPSIMYCADVLPNGNVTLTWQIPSDTGVIDTNKYFKKHYIYRSVGGGPYLLRDSVSAITTLSYTDLTANAQIGSISYYLETKSGCDLRPRPSTDSLATIFLQVSQVGTNASLNWTPLSIPLPAGSAPRYYIYKESLPAGSNAWTLIDSVPNNILNYQDPVTVCSDSVNYYVSLRNNIGNCISRSNIDGALLTSPLPNIKPPSLRCISVLPNEDIQVSWVGTIDTASFFDKYNVYHSTVKAGPYTLIGTVTNYTTNTFAHVGAQGNAQIHYYYIKTSAGCNSTNVGESALTSDTLASMKLNLNNATVGFADLTWNPIKTPNLPITSSPTYAVYRRVLPSVAWVLRGNPVFTATTFRDTINLCDTIIEYKVEISDASGCISTSSDSSARFTSLGNIINAPDLRCVSVQNNGQILLNFIPPAGASTNFNEYEVWRNSGAGFVLYDSISNFAATTYLDINANGNNQSYSYYLLTQSGCTGRVNSPTNSVTLKSIYLTTTPVLGQANLNWTALATPLPVTSNPNQYQIYSSYNAAGTLNLYGDTALTTYFQSISNCDTTIRYQIRVIDGSGCVSNSNIDTNDYTYIGNIINNPDLRCVSVQNNGQVLLNFVPPTGSNANFNEYEVWRNDGTGFIRYDSISNFAATTYLDINANGNNQSYSYYLLTQSGCTGQVNSATNSATLKSIYLTTTPVLGQANLNWTALATPLPVTSNPNQYQIYSSYNAAGTLNLYGDTALTTYFQPISNCDTTIRYQIRVIDGSGCVSNSNIDTNDYTYIGNIINNPDLRCVSVQNNGQILLNFIPPAGSNADFNEYEVWRNNGTGFVRYDSISSFVTTYLDINANGNNQSYSYYLLTQSGCSGQINSPTNSVTLKSIYLTTTPILGQANLNWTALATPLPVTSNPNQYQIYSSYNAAGTLNLYGDTALTTYFQPISNCDTTIRYQIRVIDGSGCVSNSNIDTNDYTYIGNIINNPDLRCVSVQNNGQILLNFIPPAGSNADFNEYEVWRNDGTGFVRYDSISNFAATTYLDINANGNNQSYSYYLLTQSGCSGQINSPTNSVTLKSIYLTTTPVLGQANLNWTALATPLPVTSNPNQYQIYSSYNAAGTLNLYGDTALTTYFQPISNCDTTIRYQIRVIDGSGCVSNSNIDTNDYTYIGNIINNPDLRCVSVQNNGQVLLNFVPPTGSNANFNEYEVWRNDGTGFIRYDSISNFAATTYLDINANGNNQSYSYYLLTQSGCTGQVNSATNSATLNSIYLTTTPVLGQADLNWTALATPLPVTSNPNQYQIYSSYNVTGTLNLYGDTALTTYFQPISNCDTTIRYQIRVIDGSGCVSNSNIDTNDYTYIGNIINNPDLRCVSVQNNGQILLNFIPPAGSNANYNEYEVWRNDGTGFVRYDSISNFAATTYLDINANGNNQSYSYYLLTQSGCTGQVNSATNSATLNSIYLTTTPVLGQANLNWTALATPLPVTSNPNQYQIYSSYNAAGTLNLYGDTALTTYFQPISNCDTTIRYQIRVIDGSGCVSNSNIDTNDYTYIGNIINNPDLRCVSVQNNGQILLNFVPPSGSNVNYNEYEVWRNDGTGFVRYDSISNFAATTYLDINANGNNQSYSYYLLTQSGCTGQVNSATNSATLNSIYLTTTPVLGQANLNWTALATPLPVTSNPGEYQIYSSYNATGTLNLYGDTALTTYFQPISNCDTTIRYQVTVIDGSGCVSNSNIDTNDYTYIGNIINNPDLRCVSVQNNGQVLLNFVPPSGSNVNYNEYEVWRNDGTGFVRYDSISNFAATTYLDINANGNNQSYSYYLLTQSGCTGQVNSATNSATLNSIYLTTTPVLGQANLNWTALATPLPVTSNPGEYQIYSSYNATGTLNLYGDTALTTYFQPISNCDTTIRYQVTVIDGSGCVSNSNVDTNTYTYIGNIIDNPEIRCANVNPNGQVELTWVNSTPSSWINFNQYNLYSNNGGIFTLIDSIQNNTTTTYTNVSVNANLNSISYYMVTKAGCTGQVDNGTLGNTFSTILLKVTGGNTSQATLNWNAPTNPLLPTSNGSYLVEREFIGGSGNWTTAGTVTTTTFTEPLDVCIDSVNYRVSINDAVSCSSVSNVDGEIFVDHTIPDAPSIRCLNVFGNGNVDISWVVPVDTGKKFGSYEIYSSNSANGPFTLKQTITNYNTSNYIDASINAQNSSYYYYITTKTACGGETSLPSDTLRSMKLDVINNTGVAIVSWNPLHNPELTSATGSYDVYREYPTSVWNLIGTTNAPIYQWFDTINVCQAIINYRVVTSDISGCSSTSSIDGDLFKDITKPTVSSIDTVSLDPLNPSQISMSWIPSPSGDVVGYILYHFNGASWDSIGAVNGVNNTLYQFTDASAASAPQLYSITAFDSCGNRSNLGSAHTTLFTTAKLDICRAAIDVRWNPYINMVGGVAKYNIFVSENGGPYSYLASVPGNNISYSDTNLTNGSTYCYFIQAEGNISSRTASSTTSCETADLLVEPTFSYLKKATVIDDRRVIVEVHVDVVNNPDVSKYKLQRSFDKSGPFSTVSAINYTGLPIVTFADFTARTDEYSYYYRVITIDSCGNEVLISNVGRTILLTGQPDYNLVNKLTFNDYEEWLGGVQNYSLFRQVDNVWEPTPITTVPFGQTKIDDDVAGIYQTSGRFCYRIEAYEGAGNTYGFTDTSVSNVFCLIQEPHLFIPNAFTPGGKNPILKPSFIFIESKNYFFVLFDRWGQKVYETRNPMDGWDGTYKGKIAPEGTYAYQVRIFGTNGQVIEKSGSVTLLR